MGNLRVRLSPPFKGKKLVIGASAIFAAFCFVVSMIYLFHAFVNGFSAAFPGGSWDILFSFLTGIICLTNVYVFRRADRHFVEVGDRQIKVSLPEDKTVRIIPISDIKDIDIELTDILLKLETEVIDIKLGFISYGQVRELKERFEELKLRVGGMNVENPE